MAFKPSGISPKGIVGRVVADAEEKFNGSVTEIRLAIDHGYKDKTSGEWRKTSTTWLTYSAAGAYAGPLSVASKGDLVEISGDWALETREYDRKDGTKGLQVTARYGDFEVIEFKRDSEQNDGFVPANAGGGWG